MNRSTMKQRLLYMMREDTGSFLIRVIAVLSYLAGIIFTGRYSDSIAQAAEEPLTSPVVRIAMSHFPLFVCIVGGAAVAFCFIHPFSRRRTEKKLRSVGMVNRTDEAPVLERKQQDKKNQNATIWRFRNNGIALGTWEDKKADIETALGVIIVSIRYWGGNQRILLTTVPAENGLPDCIVWKEQYLSPNSFELMLGRGYTGNVSVNLADIPHILLGGATGSGKSVLLKCLILQAVQKGASVAIADFKGGVDFPLSWRPKCHMCFNEKSLIELLNNYTATLEERKILFGEAGIPNLDEYNETNGTQLQRFILACDEIAEVLDKTGLSKEQKETVAQIESRLSLIARQGRAFGIHLILATQRPDANILSGQIRNNINCRICGRADNVLSQIILDNTDAAEQIPKQAKGRFLLHDGTIFQGYLLEKVEL